jgi:hypothetical protein
MMHGKKEAWDEYAKWPEEDLQRYTSFLQHFQSELKDSGIFVDTRELGWPQQAKLIRAAGEGEPVAEVVFSEEKEFLVGYWVIDVESPEEAYKVAARVSAAPGCGGRPANLPIEVRRVLTAKYDVGA